MLCSVADVICPFTVLSAVVCHGEAVAANVYCADVI